MSTLKSLSMACFALLLAGCMNAARLQHVKAMGVIDVGRDASVTVDATTEATESDRLEQSWMDACFDRGAELGRSLSIQMAFPEFDLSTFKYLDGRKEMQWIGVMFGAQTRVRIGGIFGNVRVKGANDSTVEALDEYTRKFIADIVAPDQENLRIWTSVRGAWVTRTVVVEMCTEGECAGWLNLALTNWAYRNSHVTDPKDGAWLLPIYGSASLSSLEPEGIGASVARLFTAYEGIISFEPTAVELFDPETRLSLGCIHPDKG